MNKIQHVFIVGAKSLGAYGGYETFVNKLTEYHQNNENIKYHVACKANGQGSMRPEEMTGTKILDEKTFVYHNAECFRITVPEKLGAAQAIYYDCKALSECIRIIKRDKIQNPIVYVLACRIGPFYGKYVRQIHKLGGKVFVNPDGHEWMRAKWSKPVRQYWKVSERLMIKHSDLIICDSINIEKYIKETYVKYNPKTTYIAYGAETRKSVGAEERYKKWLEEKGLRDGEYYLVVGRFVPENNYEIMIREFMKSNSEKDFAIVTNVNDLFLEELESKLHFRNDKRIKFVGTVYDQELLMKIREQAYGYFHGHEVGGTNPSLLEALSSTKLNLLLEVGFNREVAKDTAIYWNKTEGDLKTCIEHSDKLNHDERELYGKKSRERIAACFSWNYISDKYYKVFIEE